MNDRSRSLSGLLNDLAATARDLYGENAAALSRLTQEVQSAPGINPALMDAASLPEMPQAAGTKPAPTVSAVPVKPALPPFSALWKVADEAIDWTEALISPTPTDGLTAPEKWALYHEQAARVLHGDVPAYLNVLRAANPMGDLMPYVSALDVSAESSESLRAVFTVRDDLMETEPERYLSGMALRIARDLFAVLPVTSVTVLGRQGKCEMLRVEFSRQELNKVRFAFIDPVDFVSQSGGVFTLADA